MNEWILKYLEFYDASVTKTKTVGEVIISKLNGSETNLIVTINLITLYNVLLAKYQDDITVNIDISNDKELLSINSNDKNFLEDIMFEYGGYIDEGFKENFKYTLQIFDFYKKTEIIATI